MSNYYCGYAIPITHFQGFLDNKNSVEGAIRTAIDYRDASLYLNGHEAPESKAMKVKACGKITPNIDAEIQVRDGLHYKTVKVNPELEVSKEAGIDTDTKWIEFEGSQDDCEVKVKSYAILDHEVIACLYYKS